MGIIIRTAAAPAGPVATGDTATVDFDDTVSIPVLTNDTGTSISIQSVDDSSAQGTATISGNDIIYDTDGAFDSLSSGTDDTDQFSYTIVDSFGQTSTATVTVTVEKPATASVTNDSALVRFDSTVSIQVLGNDTGSGLSIQSIDTTNTDGTASISGNEIVYDTNGQFDFLSPSSSVTDEFDYTIVDSSNQTSTGTVTVTVAKPAAIVAAGGFSTGQNLGGVAFDPTGTVMFTVGDDEIKQWNLSVGFDVVTATFSGNSVSLSGTDSSEHTGIHVRPDGTKMWIVGNDDDRIYASTLNTPWDLSSTGVGGSGRPPGGGPGDFEPSDIVFNSDGTRVWIVGKFFGSIFQWNLDTDWFLFSQDDQKDETTFVDDPTGLAFSSDGMLVFFSSIFPSRISSFELPTPFDTSDFGNASKKEFDPGFQPFDVTFKDDGSRMFTVSGGTVSQFDLATPFSLE